ncbi:MAG: methionine--tRNA ligase [Cellvibrionales bacterium]|nr:methionine--tRNA ligase [Cellvibrionales bacterium]
MPRRRILVTSALPYANAPLHLGHILEAVQTDIWVRFQRARGHECHYVCADDAHGTAIMLKAEERSISPEAHIAEIHRSHQQDLRHFLIALDHYHSTHSDENRQLCTQIYRRLKANGHIISRRITQAFDEKKGLFLADRFIKGRCPQCGAPDQYGDHCEQCGATYAPTDLQNPVSVLSGTPPINRESEHYFFDLPQLADFLRDWLTSGSLQTEVANKLREWLEAGLHPWDISRDAPYFGFAIPGAPDKFFYVWLDAPIGYMASFQNLAERNGLKFDDFWAQENQEKTELFHFIGKDIINFHGLFWPAMLHSAGLRTPSGIFAHGFVTVDGTKMSKSRGTFINAATWLQHLGPEPLRYYYAAKLGPGVEDIDLCLQDFVVRVNADLVGKLINIASRCAGFVAKLGNNRLSAALADPALWQAALAAGDSIAAHYENREYAKAMRTIMRQADAANEYIAARQPWKLAKQPDHAAEVLAICSMGLNLFRVLMIYLQPVLPDMAAKSAAFLQSDLNWTDDIEPLLDHPIAPFKPLMRRIEQAQVEAVIAASKPPPDTPAPANHTAPEPHSEIIELADFSKIDLRVARILEASSVAGADKLLRLKLDLGGKTRTVFAGIKTHYRPEDLIGRHTVLVANLKPRKMRFGTSEGMVLCAADGENLHLLEPHADASPGSRIA